jgi:hypothetical protein
MHRSAGEAPTLPETTAFHHEQSTHRTPHAGAHPRRTRTAKPSRDKGMNNIRLKISIELNGNHALSAHDLNGLKPLIERGIAAALPDALSVDRIRVTKVKEIPSRQEERPQIGGAPPASNPLSFPHLRR